MVWPFLTGLGVSLAVSLGAGALGGVILYFTPVPEHYLGTMALLAAILGVFVGGFVYARQVGTRGLWHGAQVGLGYVVVAIIITLLVANHPWQTGTFFGFLAYSVIAGGLGGLVGVSSG